MSNTLPPVGQQRMVRPCKRCSGTGRRFNVTKSKITSCGYCKGTGETPEQQIITCPCGMKLNTHNARSHRQICEIWQNQWSNDSSSATGREKSGQFAEAHGWEVVCDANMPPLDEIVWLWDGQRLWIGGRADDCEGWLWGNTYGSIWHNGVKWDGDLETDDDYKPTHWMRLPQPPNAKDEATAKKKP